MAMQSDYRGYTAQAAVGAYLIVKHGTGDQTCLVATAATDALIGTSDALSKAIGEIVDVGYGPLGEVLLGGAVTRGQPLTANATGQAVPAATGNRIIGFADMSGVANDVITFQRAPGVL